MAKYMLAKNAAFTAGPKLLKKGLANNHSPAKVQNNSLSGHY
jgi:hypothetical protein